MKSFVPLLCVLLLAPFVSAEDAKPICLSNGDPAPVFEATDDQGNRWNLKDHLGKRMVVVYFYPADMTSLCTTQACSFRDTLEELADAGVMVVGVSGDSARNHQLFKKSHSLNFPLLADEDGKVARMFGVPVRKGGEITRVIQGKQEKLIRGVTAQRWTFVIGLDGRIIHRDTDVNAADNGKTVLKFVRQMTVAAQ